MDLRRLLRAAPFVLVGLGVVKMAGLLVVGPRLGLPTAPLLAAGVLWVVGPAAVGVYLQRAHSASRRLDGTTTRDGHDDVSMRPVAVVARRRSVVSRRRRMRAWRQQLRASESDVARPESLGAPMS